MDLLPPNRASTNDFVSPLLCLESLSYASVGNAAAYIFEAERGVLLIKLHIVLAYPNIPLYPGDRHLVSIQWQGKTYVDTYRIAGNFQGRKSSRISRFYSHPRKFSPRNLGMPHTLCDQFNIPRKFSPQNVSFLSICKNFLPRKFPAIR